MNNISNMNITRATNSYRFTVPFDSEDINRSVDKVGILYILMIVIFMVVDF